MKIMKLEQILLNVKQINNMIKVINPSVDDWEHYIDLRSNGVSGAPHPMAKELADKVDDLINPTTCE